MARCVLNRSAMPLWPETNLEGEEIVRTGLAIPSDEVQRQSMRSEMLRRASLLQHGFSTEESESEPSSTTIDVQSNEATQK